MRSKRHISRTIFKKELGEVIDRRVFDMVNLKYVAFG